MAHDRHAQLHLSTTRLPKGARHWTARASDLSRRHRMPWRVYSVQVPEGCFNYWSMQISELPGWSCICRSGAAPLGEDPAHRRALRRLTILFLKMKMPGRI